MALNSGTNDYLFFMQEMEEQPVSTYRVQSGLRITAAPLAQQTYRHAGSGLTLPCWRYITTAQEAAISKIKSNHPPRRAASLSLNIPRLDTFSCLPALPFSGRSTGRKPSSCFASPQNSLRNMEEASELSKIR